MSILKFYKKHKANKVFRCSLNTILSGPNTWANKKSKEAIKNNHRCSSIYIIRRGKKVIYVGRTKEKVRTRLLSHMTANKYKLGKYLNNLNGRYVGHTVEIRMYTSVNYSSDLDFTESSFIRDYKPELNTANNF